MQTDHPRSRRRLHPWAGVVAGLVLVVAAAWATDFIPGDVNDDGVFDVLDSTVLRRDLAGLEPGITQEMHCGNGVLDAGEECDSGMSCSDLGFAFGKLSCGAGCMAEIDTCTNDRFEDLGLTVFDHQTGLEWEKKTGSAGAIVGCFFNPDSGGTCSDLNDVNNLYVWTSASGEWLSRLNGLTSDPNGANQSGFAGHSDWRLPNLADLLGIHDLSAPGCGVSPFPPCVDSIFLPTSTVGTTNYWSSSSGVPGLPDSVWSVSFSSDEFRVFSGSKSTTGWVRAVRDGPPICGDGLLNQAGEECDSPNDSACPGECRSDCTCPAPPICGDGVVNQLEEVCDLFDDSACPGSCEASCTCRNPFLNEVDADQTATDLAEFVELSDRGLLGITSLDGLFLVLCNGSAAGNTSYRVEDLDGHFMNRHFVIGNIDGANLATFPETGWLQNGTDAVALYRGNGLPPPQVGLPCLSTMISSGMEYELVDALVYDTSDPDDIELQIGLNQSQQYDENANGRSGTESLQIQACPGGDFVWIPGEPTPGLPNVDNSLNCPP